MAGTLHLTIVSPSKMVFDGQVAMVEVPGTEGDMGVLPAHAATLSMLRPGTVTIHGTDRSVTRYHVNDGYADITATGCTILAESIEAA